MVESTLKGSCLCGGVAYEMSPPFIFFHHCHCSRCRKSSGSAYGANILVKAAQFRWTRGEELVGRWDLLVHLDYLDEKEKAKYQPAPQESVII